jgi:hypothetical protein
VADAKTTALTALATPSVDDLLYIVDDPGGTPVGKKITLANLLKASGITYSFAFAFDDAAIEDGLTVYTPAVGEELVDFRVEIGTGFDGTTPYADLSHGNAQGLFAWTIGTAIPLGTADTTSNGLSQGTVQYYGQSAMQASTYNGYRTVPAIFTTTDPLLVVVSQDGQLGGAAVGGTAGAAILYFTICTPIAL